MCHNFCREYLHFVSESLSLVLTLAISLVRPGDVDDGDLRNNIYSTEHNDEFMPQFTSLGNIQSTRNAEFRRLAWKTISISLIAGNSISSICFSPFWYTLKWVFRLDRPCFGICTCILHLPKVSLIKLQFLLTFKNACSLQRIFLTLKSISCLFIPAKLNFHLEGLVLLKKQIFLSELFLRKNSQCTPSVFRHFN